MRILQCYNCDTEYYAPLGWFNGCPTCDLNLDEKKIEKLKVGAGL